MTFNPLGIGEALVLGNPSGDAGGRQLVHTYITNDPMSAVIASDYFLPFYGRVKAGDPMLVVVDVDGSHDFALIQFDTVSSSGVTTRRNIYDVEGDQTTIPDMAAITFDPTGIDTGTDMTAAQAAALDSDLDRIVGKVNAIIANLEASGLNATS